MVSQEKVARAAFHNRARHREPLSYPKPNALSIIPSAHVSKGELRVAGCCLTDVEASRSDAREIGQPAIHAAMHASSR